MTTELETLGDLADTAAELADLRSSADEILARAWSVERTREQLGGDSPAWAEDLWATLADLGWPDLLVPESGGGGGATVAALCTLAEAAGAVAATTPLVPVAVAAWLTGAPVGSAVTLPLDPALSAAPLGEERLVPFGAIAEGFLFLDGERRLCRVARGAPGVHVTPARPLDHGPAAIVRIDADAEVDVVSADDAAVRWERAATAVLLGRLAELIGTAAAANAAAASYATERVAFGRPIGTFQAIKHRLVDQRADIEVARALVRRAADAVDGGAPDAGALTSLAVTWGQERLRRVPEGATQVFGGIAYTWEHEMHVHLRRAACLAASLGSRRGHRAAVVDWLAAGHQERSDRR